MDIPAVLLSSVERAPWGWGLLLAVILATVKVWPVIQLQTMNARRELRSERKDDLDDCKKRLDDFQTQLNTQRDDYTRKLTAQTNQIHQLDLKLVGTVAAYRIMHDHIEGSDPDSEALAQALRCRGRFLRYDRA